jgi:hypothetical protein
MLEDREEALQKLMSNPAQFLKDPKPFFLPVTLIEAKSKETLFPVDQNFPQLAIEAAAYCQQQKCAFRLDGRGKTYANLCWNWL